MYKAIANFATSWRSGGRYRIFLRGGAQIMDWQKFNICENKGVSEGDVHRQKQRKNVIFKVNLYDLEAGAYFLPEAPTWSQAPYLCKK